MHCRYVDTREKQVERLKGTGGLRMFERIKRVFRLPRTRVLSIHESPFFFSLRFFPLPSFFLFFRAFLPFHGVTRPFEGKRSRIERRCRRSFIAAGNISRACTVRQMRRVGRASRIHSNSVLRHIRTIASSAHDCRRHLFQRFAKDNAVSNKQTFPPRFRGAHPR